jgi:hypothetical protein
MFPFQQVSSIPLHSGTGCVEAMHPVEGAIFASHATEQSGPSIHVNPSEWHNGPPSGSFAKGLVQAQTNTCLPSHFKLSVAGLQGERPQPSSRTGSVAAAANFSWHRNRRRFIGKRMPPHRSGPATHSSSPSRLVLARPAMRVGVGGHCFNQADFATRTPPTTALEEKLNMPAPVIDSTNFPIAVQGPSGAAGEPPHVRLQPAERAVSNAIPAAVGAPKGRVHHPYPRLDRDASR